MIFTVPALVLLNFVFTDADPIGQAPDTRNKQNKDAHNVFSSYMITLDKSPIRNPVSVDEENLIRLPVHKENKTKKKYSKIPPKSTIQKIIKKNKYKKKFNKVTSEPTMATNEFQDYKKETLPESTTEIKNIKKRKLNKKWKATQARLPNPFLKFKKDQMFHHRLKRELTPENDRALYILQDLDETEFISSENGNDKVIAHIKNYW